MTYTTASGDCWDNIAYKTLGASKYSQLLMRHNPKHLDKMIFPAGIKLTVPEVTKVQVNKLPPWKK